MSRKYVSRQFLREVRDTVLRYRMIPRGTGVVVAVSGGPDSTAMLHALCELSREMHVRVVAAHLDHGLREESPDDADFARRLAGELGVDFRCLRADVLGKARSEGVSVEEAGRLVRYEFLEHVRGAMGLDVIAAGHHRDDALETFFLRLFRGSSVEGLCGIPAVRGNIVRPLISVTRSQIMEFLEKNDLPYRVDRTNLESAADRNFVRNELLPFIEHRFPGFRKSMARTIKVIDTEDKFLELKTEELYSFTVSRRCEELLLDRKRLSESPEALAKRVVLKALQTFSGTRARYTQAHLDLIFSLFFSSRPSARVHLPHGLKMQRDYDQIRLGYLTQDRTAQPFSIVVEGPGLVRLPDSDLCFRFRVVDSGTDRIDFGTPDTVYFDAENLPFPMVLRSPRPGDRFQAWGMEGKRKLKKILIDAKVPLQGRQGLPLVERDGEIIWIPYLRRGFHAPVDSDTRRLLEIRVYREISSMESTDSGIAGGVQ